MKIAILYICTGNYIVFWDDFFESFEKFFLPEFEKEYFVFSDADFLKGQETGRVHLNHIFWQPWPVPTLMKFHTFLLIENKLKKFDYIYQPNSNARCRRIVTADEFLPRKNKGEVLFFTMHPGKWISKGFRYPYYRNPKSFAYVPYNRRTKEVFGAMNGGEGKAFLIFMKEMASRTAQDLKKCIIPISHDESYVNNYLVRHAYDTSIRFLTCDYAYPQEYQLPFERVIELEDKSKYFNVSQMKSVGTVSKNKTIIEKIWSRSQTYREKMDVSVKIITDTVFRKKAN